MSLYLFCRFKFMPRSRKSENILVCRAQSTVSVKSERDICLLRLTFYPPELSPQDCLDGTVFVLRCFTTVVALVSTG